MTIRARLLFGFALVGLALVAAPLALYMRQSSRALQLARQERSGMVPVKTLLKLVQLLQQHRGLSSGVLEGRQTMETQRAAKQIETNKAVAAFDAIVRSDIRDATLIDEWRRAVDTWKGLARDVSSRSITSEESLTGHTALIADTLKLLDLILDYFDLSYTETGQDYHLIMALLVRLPTLTEFLGQARAHGTALLVQKRVTLADRTVLVGLLSNVQRQHDFMARELDKAMALNPRTKVDLGNFAQKSMTLAQQAIDLARTRVVEVETPDYSPADYFVQFTRAVDGQFALLDHAMVNLEATLRARVAALRNEQIGLIVFMALVVAFSAWLATVLIRTIRQDVAAEAKRTEAELAGAALRRLNDLLEQEARRIAHALHDEAGQLLAVVHIALDDCARDLPPAARERLHEVRGHLDQIEEQLRRLSHELRPTILDNLGLVPALKFLAEGISKRTGLPITVDGSTEGRLPASIETAIYRVVQEGLNNATRHARAGSVSIQLQREDRQIRCAILDDGVGFNLSAVLAQAGDRGLGLIGMQERLKALNGALQITSAPDQGTALRITIPLEA
ncbi:MAG: hypothetical protein C3F08_05955 [Candidatus Methylomirabilota bacterium]|nr:MAG: hypothetical protein C3F08_05955 [candidate division NC10 bacterium]